MSKTITRQQLYDLVWAEPVKNLAAQFAVSDVWLSKLCRKHGIPQPPRGYWAKLHAGKKVSRFPLQPRGLGMPEELTLGREEYWTTRADDDELIASEIGPPPVFEEKLDAIRERVQQEVGKVGAPCNLSRPHHAISALLQADDERRTKYLAARYPSMFDAPLFDSPFERRRLSIMNALMLALARLGAKPSLRGKDPAGFSITVGEQHFAITVDEPEYQRTGWRSDHDLPKPANTTIRIHIGSYSSGTSYSWEDRGKDRVEDHLTEIVVTAMVAGEEAYRSRQISAREWRIKRKAELIEQRRQEKEERERKELERLAAEERARIDGLLAQADSHRRANDIRAYVAEVRSQLAGAVDDEVLANWSRWALEQAERLDPMTNGQLAAALAGGVTPLQTQ